MDTLSVYLSTSEAWTLSVYLSTSEAPTLCLSTCPLQRHGRSVSLPVHFRRHVHSLCLPVHSGGLNFLNICDLPRDGIL
jgi:hypothetical protein